MQELSNLDLRHLVDPFALEIVREQVADEIQRNRKKDSALETLLYLREKGIPFKEVLALAKRMKP